MSVPSSGRSSSFPLSLLGIAFVSSGCGASSSTSAEAQVSMGAGPASSEEWRCGGDLVPPTSWEQQPSFEDAQTPNTRDVAMRKASKELARRLCAGAGDCEDLNAYVTPWKTGSNGREICAMAVVEKEALEEWRGRAMSLSSLDEALGKAAGDLAKKAGNRPRMAIAEIVDMGVPGGQRAEWLRARMSRALQRHGDIVDVPKGWSGSRAPLDLTLVVRGTIVARSERGIAMLESVWEGVNSSGSRVFSEPVAFPESASPHAPVPPMPTLPRAEGIHVRLDSSRGGSLCAGEWTQIWLESDRDAAIAVVNLYGAGEALLTFPNDDVASPRVAARKTVALGGPLGFEAVPVPGYDQERFLVIAASSEAELGPYRGKKGPCRLPADKARELSQGRGLPAGTRSASTGYRIVQDASCPAPPAPGTREGVVQAIASLPVCAL